MWYWRTCENMPKPDCTYATSLWKNFKKMLNLFWDDCKSNHYIKKISSTTPWDAWMAFKPFLKYTYTLHHSPHFIRSVPLSGNFSKCTGLGRAITNQSGQLAFIKRVQTKFPREPQIARRASCLEKSQASRCLFIPIFTAPMHDQPWIFYIPWVF